MRKPHNQWHESAFLRALEKKGGVKRQTGGSTIEYPIDYQQNAGGDFLASSTTATSVSQTDVIAGASYSFAELVVPINWTFNDEAANRGEQKIPFVKNIIQNAVNTHDQLIEAGLFTTSTDGFLGMANLIPTSGQPNVGSIDGASAAYWRNYADSYLADGSDLEAALTVAYLTVGKGTGSNLAPKILVSGPDGIGLYESTLQPLQRFEGQEGAGGYKSLAFKDADFVYSQNGGTKIYGLNPTSFNLVVNTGAWRTLNDSVQMSAAAMMNQKIYSRLQACINNPSRLFVLDVA
jgi:hypothetical protein